MRKMNLLIAGLYVIISKWASLTTADEEQAKCSHNTVVMAMSKCQGERQKLSFASQSNNTGELCRALEVYADCMRPKIGDCEGPAKMAFDVITRKYAKEPYNCQVESSSAQGRNDVNFKTDQENLPEDFKPSSIPTGNENMDNSLDTANDEESNDAKPQNQQPYSVETGTPPPTTTATETSKDEEKEPMPEGQEPPDQEETTTTTTAAKKGTTKAASPNTDFDPSENAAPFQCFQLNFSLLFLLVLLNFSMQFLLS